MIRYLKYPSSVLLTIVMTHQDDYRDTIHKTTVTQGVALVLQQNQRVPNQGNNHTSQKTSHKFSYTPIRPKNTTKSKGQVLTSANKKLPSPVSDSSQQQQNEHRRTTNTVKPTSASSSFSSNVSSSDIISVVDNSSTLDATTNNVKNVPSLTSLPSKVSSNDRISTVDRPAYLDVTTFTLSLDPSNFSDTDTDASASSAGDNRRLGSGVI